MKSRLMTRLALAATVAFAAAVGVRAENANYLWKVGPMPSSITSTSGYSVYFFATSDPSGKYSNYLTSLSAVVAEVNKGSSADFASLNSSSTGYYVQGSTYRWNNDSQFYAQHSRADYNEAIASAASFIALILDSSSISTANNYMIAQTSGGVQELTPTRTDGIKGGSSTTQFDTYTWDWGSQANNSWIKVGSVIPEPTSGVLLLVGVAALALRRKKAA